jgi:uncharacterized iron-regulated membrane protein
MNTLARILSLIVPALLLVGALVAGAVVGAVLLGLLFIGALVFGARLWWFRRKLRRNGAAAAADPAFRPAPAKDAIDVEYSVIDDGVDAARRDASQQLDRDR